MVVVVGAPGRQRCAFVLSAGSQRWTPKFGVEFQLGGRKIVENF